MARNARTHGLGGRLLKGRLALASAALATFTMFGGTVFADEPTTESVNQASDDVVLEAPATWTVPALLTREKEQRGNDDGAFHARKGADDGAGDDRGRVARHGNDDPAGDDRGRVARHGKDDGANHG